MTPLERMAKKYRLKIRPDICGEPIIPGKYGHLYEYDDSKLGVMYMPDEVGLFRTSPTKWTNRKHKMLAAGFTIDLDCDGEGTALFDPTVPKQVKLAIEVAGIKRKRVMSEAQLAALQKARAMSPISQSAPCAEGIHSP